LIIYFIHKNMYFDNFLLYFQHYSFLCLVKFVQDFPTNLVCWCNTSTQPHQHHNTTTAQHINITSQHNTSHHNTSQHNTSTSQHINITTYQHHNTSHHNISTSQHITSQHITSQHINITTNTSTSKEKKICSNVAMNWNCISTSILFQHWNNFCSMLEQQTIYCSTFQQFCSNIGTIYFIVPVLEQFIFIVPVLEQSKIKAALYIASHHVMNRCQYSIPISQKLLPNGANHRIRRRMIFSKWIATMWLQCCQSRDVKIVFFCVIDTTPMSKKTITVF